MIRSSYVLLEKNKPGYPTHRGPNQINNCRCAYFYGIGSFQQFFEAHGEGWMKITFCKSFPSSFIQWPRRHTETIKHGNDVPFVGRFASNRKKS